MTQFTPDSLREMGFEELIGVTMNLAEMIEKLEAIPESVLEQEMDKLTADLEAANAGIQEKEETIGKLQEKYLGAIAKLTEAQGYIAELEAKCESLDKTMESDNESYERAQKLAERNEELHRLSQSQITRAVNAEQEVKRLTFKILEVKAAAWDFFSDVGQ